MGDDEHDYDTEVEGVESQTETGADAESGEKSGPKSKIIKW